MTTSKRSLIILVFVAIFGALTVGAAVAETRSNAGRTYIVVLNPQRVGRSDLKAEDVRALGGDIIGRAVGQLIVTLPAGAVDRLRENPAVRYVQEVDGTPAPHRDGNDNESVAPTSVLRLHAGAMQAAPTWSSGVYKYDAAGNIYAIGTAGGGESGDHVATTYTYDSLSRLIEVDALNTTTNQYVRNEYYGYDNYGNLTRTVGPNGTAITMSVDSSTNRLQSTNSGLAATYDAEGRMRTLGTDTYTYDAGNMLTDRDHDAGWHDYYLYTADDERIGQQVGDTWTWSVRDRDAKVLREYQSSASAPANPWLWVEDYVYASGRLIAGERPPEMGGRRHFHLDHLGTPRLITGTPKEAVSQHDFYAFGVEITPNTPEVVNGFDREEPMKFTGHERDYTGYNWSSLPLDYMHSRSYASYLGRFLSVDPARADPQQPQLWDRYTYVANNPANRADPTGKFGESAEERLGAEFLGFDIGPHVPCLPGSPNCACLSCMANQKPGKTPPSRWPQPPVDVVGKKPRWNSEGYWEGKGGRKLTWDDRSHGAGVDRGEGAQGGHWDDEESNNRWDEDGKLLPGSADLDTAQKQMFRIMNGGLLYVMLQTLQGASRVANFVFDPSNYTLDSSTYITNPAPYTLSPSTYLLNP